MSDSRRRLLVILILLALIAALLLFLGPCARRTVPVETPVRPKAEARVSGEAPPPAAAAPRAEEVLTAATVQAPARVDAGASFSATWTGPANEGDYLTLVRPDAAASQYGNYREVREGKTLELTAPMDPGEWEVRYVTARSKQVLGRTTLTVAPVTATLSAPDEAILGTAVTVTWTGPNNVSDYLCIVPAGAPPEQVGNYTDAARGSPLTITAPVDAGPAEIRYVSAQGRRVLARRPIRILTPETSLAADATVTAGSKFKVSWRGPKNPGDYVTIVPKGMPDGQYRNYADTAKGTTLELTALIDAGPAEVRYMTGTGARVLARRPIEIKPAAIAIDAASQVAPGAAVTVTWSGPKNEGDYLTIVPKALPDGRYAAYADASKGSPVTIKAPAEAGPAEIRYMSGQGARVLARRALTVVAP